MDEHRVGLRPALRRVWVPPGEAPSNGASRLRVALRRGIRAPRERTKPLLAPLGGDGPVFDQLLKAFAEEQGARRRECILLMLDQAGKHDSHGVSPSKGLTLLDLPSYFPELQAVERVRPLVYEPLANRALGKLAGVKTVLEYRCVRLTEMPEVIRAHTLLGW